ncbi:MAG: putative molybdenum carrier protein [Planctomycetaceae bacterium]|nr:putative molybdenum carrier protein [Planctomycetaceae bacterium]MCB9949922.1 putative molybdenum carrier protein [Planctomycetaceae bacterium]
MLFDRLPMIVSGGQTGVDRAALDAALAHGLECGGWCPKGRLAEDGQISSRYPLREASSAIYAQRTRLNVRDSSATLILTWGEPTGGTALTIRFAEQYKRPCLVIDLARNSGKSSLQQVVKWIKTEAITTLNVAGPRESGSPGIYVASLALLNEVFRQLVRRKTEAPVQR